MFWWADSKASRSALRIAARGIVVDTTHGFDGEVAGFLPTFVPAHAVGHDGETALATEILVGIGLPIKIGVFVIGTLAADVGQARRFDAGLRSFQVDGHGERSQRWAPT